jgi:virginiamycin A acetyltransferase
LYGADPKDKHPMKGFSQICFIQNTVSNPNIIVGDYTYYDDPEDSENFERNVLYHFPFIGDRLIIGKFCALARGVKFIMNGANHKLDGLSTYPFQIFGNGWEKVTPQTGELPYKGDTVIGNDVWIGLVVQKTFCESHLRLSKNTRTTLKPSRHVNSINTLCE